MRIVVIGSVAAGTSVAAKARRNNENCEIVIYEKDTDISYSICGLPYYIGEEYITRDDLTPRNPLWFKTRFNIDIKTQHEVMEIITKGKKIKVKNLITTEIFYDKYDKLVIATGAIPVKPNIEGINSNFVFTLRNVNDADKIKEFIKNNNVKNATIIGGGFIGLEVLENIVNLGIKSTLIEGLNQVMPPFDREMAKYIENHIKEKNVNLMLAEKVIKLDENNKTVITETGKKIKSDIVIVSIGVKPNVTLAQKAGIEIGKTGAIKVNNRMETNIPDIFAVGDCTESFSLLTDESIYRPLGTTANKMGRIAGDVITGGNLSFRGILGTGIFKIFDLSVGITGLSEKEAKRLGYDIEIIHNIKPNQVEYFKESSEMIIKAIADRKSERLLGVQIIGKNGVDKRLDVFVTAITFGARVGDLFHLDLSYSPPFSTTKDPVMYTGMILDNAINRGRKIITASDLLENFQDYFIIDVRSPEDYEKGHIEGSVNIPLNKLREQAQYIDKSKKIVVYCNKGVSGNASQNLLINLGFSEVYNLSGGYKHYKIVKSLI